MLGISTRAPLPKRPFKASHAGVYAPADSVNRRLVNAGEKMYRRAGVKLHHRGVPNAPAEGFLLHDKQDEKRIASSANVPETSSVASPSVLPLPQSILRPAP